MVKSHQKKAQKGHRKRVKTSGSPPSALGLTKESQSQRPDSALFPIVGIGASAGGLEAFTQLLQHLPPAPGMAFVLVQHLDPKHESMLVALLSSQSRMPVCQVTDGMMVEPNHVYVIPPNVNMALVRRRLELVPRTLTRGLHMPIDYFFRSLAKDQGRQAIGVILSGSASDGALGLEAIKAEGGITLVQDDRTAKFTGMPRSAIATGSVDFILPIEGIAEELRKISRHPYITSPEHFPIEEVASPIPGKLDIVLSMLRTAKGVDFAYYKPNTIHRRIMRRMTLHKMERMEDYAKYLRSNQGELDALYHDILIKVTGFFRDPQAFDALKQEVFPSLKSRSRDTPIRIWVPGCAGGEEVYSIAMCLLECLGDKAAAIPIQIFATDIDEKVLEKARAGLYIENIALDVSPERLRRFFVKVNSHYQISKTIRDLCIFSKHNVFKDPPFSRLDLISCRNLLIYLGLPLQTNVVPLFHYALKATGFLMLGMAETIGSFPELFRLVDKKHKIYAKQMTQVRPQVYFATREHTIEAIREIGREKFIGHKFREIDPLREADRIILTHYAPAGVLVNDQMEILQFRGDTTPYLIPAPGKASLDLLKMAREGLLVELRAALLHARKTGASVTKEALQVRHNGQWRTITLKVIPLKVPSNGGRFFVVLFEEQDKQARLKLVKEDARAAVTKTGSSHREVAQLQQELAATKQYLQSIIEEYEATNEELKSASEEILSSNEELQSTNEELQTAKEELQSTNEELSTVNDEIQHRNQELTRVNSDLTNVLASVKLPMIMLGRDLRIRHFTPMAETVLKLIPTDIGRPITDLRLTIQIPELEQWIHEVIETVRTKEQDVQDQTGHWYSLQIRPYKTIDNKIDGAVLVLIDIDKAKLAQAVLRKDYATLERLAEAGSTELADMTAGKERLEVLSRRLMQAHEDERRNIARDLHDEIGQALTALKLNLHSLQREAATGKGSALHESVRIADDLIRQVRDLSLNLRPSMLDDLGLVATLRWWVEHQGPQVGVSLELTADPIEPHLPLELATACFRIVQEAVNNAVKHARAQAVSVTLRKQDNRLDLIIRDDGAGFDARTALAEAVQGKTMGLVGMEERVRALGGQLTMRSEPGRGTEVHASFPLS